MTITVSHSSALFWVRTLTWETTTMPTPNTIALSLRVRPFQSVDLCFEVGGIIGYQNPLLAVRGVRLTPFDLPGFYGNLLQSQGNTQRPGLLKYDSTAIIADLTSQSSQGPLLYSLRAENVKALLDKAIGERAELLLQKVRQ